MLCTRCAALPGSWMIHHTTNAMTTHFRMFPSFTAASLEAQTVPSCQFLNSSPRRSLDGGWSSKQVRWWACPSGSKYARYVRALRMSQSVRMYRHARQYPSPSAREEAATPAVRAEVSS